MKNKEDKMFSQIMGILGEDEKNILKQLGVQNMEDFLSHLTSDGVDLQKKEADTKYGMPPHFHFTDEDWKEEENDEIIDIDDWDPYKLPSGLILDEPAREFHIRVKLLNAPLPIWRELKVPSNISLELLSRILIETMGWENEHLHQFRTKDGTIYKDTFDLQQAKQFEGFGRPITYKNANKYSLNSVLGVKGERIKFEYDFGDSWTHEVWMKGEREYKLGEEPVAKLVKGEGACPPEDCGGVWGYARLLELMGKKRKTAEEKEQLEWYGMDKRFDPEDFDIEEQTYYIEDFWEEILQEIEERKK